MITETYHVYGDRITNHLGDVQNANIMRIMKSPHKFSFNEIESPQSTERDVFDPDPVDEEDLWFLPAPDHAVLEAADLPGPRADHRSLVDVAGWGAAEAALARPLAELCTRYGALAARLQMGPAGWGQRLAMQEAVDLSWLSGDRVAADRLAQWLTLRLAGEAEDAQALARAGWAARRLQGASKPTDDLALFLGRQSEGGAPDAVADWHEVMGQAAPLHSITQAALSYHLWPVFGIAGQYGIALPMIEAAVVSAHHATMGIAGARFVPLALGGAGGLRTAGTPQERLQRWIAGADHATRAALRMLDAVDLWEAQAQAACAELSGRTPPQLIALLRAWPLISAPMAEAGIDASRAAIQRNLNWMTKRGIIREVTGQGRYRFWTAQI